MILKKMGSIDQFLCWCDNTYEKFTHWYWNKSPHHVKCRICGEKMSSDIDKYSPEECGWKCFKDRSGWVCHSCDSHRDFTPYVFLADIDESIAWEKEYKGLYRAMKRQALKRMLKELADEDSKR